MQPTASATDGEMMGVRRKPEGYTEYTVKGKGQLKRLKRLVKMWVSQLAAGQLQWV